MQVSSFLISVADDVMLRRVLALSTVAFSGKRGDSMRHFGLFSHHAHFDLERDFYRVVTKLDTCAAADFYDVKSQFLSPH